jgi:hypothetical protein
VVVATELEGAVALGFEPAHRGNRCAQLRSQKLRVLRCSHHSIGRKWLHKQLGRQTHVEADAFQRVRSTPTMTNGSPGDHSQSKPLFTEAIAGQKMQSLNRFATPRATRNNDWLFASKNP